MSREYSWILELSFYAFIGCLGGLYLHQILKAAQAICDIRDMMVQKK